MRSACCSEAAVEAAVGNECDSYVLARIKPGAYGARAVAVCGLKMCGNVVTHAVCSRGEQHVLACPYDSGHVTCTNA